MKKKDFSGAFGTDVDEIIEPQKEISKIIEATKVQNYQNPMKELENKYQEILDIMKENENDLLKGFIKKIPQSEVYANATIQVRRDLYTCICEYITIMRMGKTKVLNEIFMLGVNEFISKYSNKIG